MINVKAMEEAARKLAAADEKFKPLVYPFHGTTDMQGEYAFCYLIVCPEYQEELLRLGLEREFCVMQAMGLGWLAEDMEGIPQEERTRCIEMVRALVVYNICGDKLYLPYEGGDARQKAGQPHGVRASNFGGFASQTLLAFLSNAASRRHFRTKHPEHYRALNEMMYNQRDLENYFSELASLLGYKPSQRMIEGKARHVDFNQMYRHDDSLGTRVRSRRERKYSQAKLALARGGRALRWHSSAGLSRQGPGFLAYVDKVRKRAARDGKAKQADKAVRFWHK